MEQEKIDTISQIVNSLEHNILRLEKASEKKDKEEFENSKRVILELQRKLSKELK
jgi:exonuclease VII small subunit